MMSLKSLAQVLGNAALRNKFQVLGLSEEASSFGIDIPVMLPFEAQGSSHGQGRAFRPRIKNLDHPTALLLTLRNLAHSTTAMRQSAAVRRMTFARKRVFGGEKDAATP
ncbi:hypothetical protein V5F79_27135 [Xanthobacter flavus]|uniref:hypothetical protein n=1 Tax=Xanthobacter flavus TaxID=281 RepID=UPI003727BAA0